VDGGQFLFASRFHYAVGCPVTPCDRAYKQEVGGSIPSPPITRQPASAALGTWLVRGARAQRHLGGGGPLGDSVVLEWTGGMWRYCPSSYLSTDLAVRRTEVWAILNDVVARWSGVKWIPLERHHPDVALQGLAVDAAGNVLGRRLPPRRRTRAANRVPVPLRPLGLPVSNSRSRHRSAGPRSRRMLECSAMHPEVAA
jgi:hypothetical protein